MTTSSSNSLATKCFYREAGSECSNGHLFWSVDGRPVLIQSINVQCPACEGKGMILSDRGREVLAFMEVFARPLLRDLVDELFEEREQH